MAPVTFTIDGSIIDGSIIDGKIIYYLLSLKTQIKKTFNKYSLGIVAHVDFKITPSYNTIFCGVICRNQDNNISFEHTRNVDVELEVAKMVKKIVINLNETYAFNELYDAIINDKCTIIELKNGTSIQTRQAAAIFYKYCDSTNHKRLICSF